MASRLASSASITVINISSDCLLYLRPPIASGDDFKGFRWTGASESWICVGKIYDFLLESWVVGNKNKTKYLDDIVIDRTLC